MIEYGNKTRSVEAWGPLSSEKCADSLFAKLTNSPPGLTKARIKDHIKTQKSLKTFRVRFIRTLQTDVVEIKAPSTYDVNSAAKKYFKEHANELEFKPVPKSTWKGDDPVNYDSISFNQVR